MTDPANPASDAARASPSVVDEVAVDPAELSGPPGRKRRRPRKRTALDHAGSAAAMLFVLVLVAMTVLVGLRFGALTPPGRAMVESALDGLRLPRVGHLVVEDLRGDPWGTFSVGRAAIRDADGEWVEARDLTVTWQPIRLLLREVDIIETGARSLTVMRQPKLVPPLFPDRDPPVSTRIRSLSVPVETLPELSVVRGLWQASGSVLVRRNQTADVRVTGDSLLQQGDVVRVLVQFAPRAPVRIEAVAREVRGGAFAGAIGLDPTRPLDMNILVTERQHVGTLRIDTRSGNQRVTDISGGWNRDGGRIAGSALLDASRHTSWIAERLGAAATVDANWRRAEGAADTVPHRLEARVAAPGGVLSLEGAYVVSESRFAAPAPIRLTLPDTGRFIAVDGIVAGAGLAEGTLSGTLAALRFQGQAQVAGLTFLGYRLGRLAGPLELQRVGRDLDIITRASGTGGAGEGLIPALLGVAPVADVSVRRLQDGRVLVRAMDVRGVGVTFTGTGDRGILGGITMRGEGRADAGRTGLPGLTGSVLGRWSLTQPRDGAPWRLDLSGRGEGLKTGEPRTDALLGPRPNLAADLEITDAGITFRTLRLEGADARFSGTGGRTAGGASRFEGDLSLGARTLAIARLDGQIEATVRAAQAGSAAPWTFGLEGSARRFSTGYDEIDRLFGDAPDLSAALVLQDGDLLVTRARLDGTAASMGAIGRVTPGRDIALQLDWSANGPFRAGQLEATGRVTGTGTLTGPVTAMTLGLDARIPEVVLPQLRFAPLDLSVRLPLASEPLAGRVELAGTTPQGVVRGEALATAVDEGLAFTGIDLAGAGVRATGTARLAGRSGARADLDVELGPGALLAAGTATGDVRIADARGGPVAQIALSGTGLRLHGMEDGLQRLSFTADGPLARMSVAGSLVTAGSAPLALDARGTVVSTDDRTDASLDLSGRSAGVAFRSTGPIQLSTGPDGDRVAGTLALARIPGAGEASAPDAGRIDLSASRRNGTVSAQARLESFALQLFNPDLLGTVTGSITLSGTGRSLTGQGRAQLEDVRSKGLSRDLALTGQFDATLDDGRLAITGRSANARGLVANVDINLPVEASAAPLRLAIIRTAPMTGSFEARGEVRPVADLFFAGERVLSGPVEARGTIAGTFNQPRVTGRFGIENGSYVEPSIGLRLTALSMQAQIMPDAVEIASLQARDGREGEVSGSGRIALSQTGAAVFDLAVRRFRLLATETSTVEASGRVRLERTEGVRTARLTGALRVDRAVFAPTALASSGVVEMEVEEINRPAPATGLAEPQQTRAGRASGSPVPPVELDVALTAPRGLTIRGRGLNLEMSLDGRVGGTLAAPQLSGMARVYRGEFDYAGRVFVFDDSGTVTLNADPARIRLNLVAERDVPGFVARIEVRGTAERPEIALTSVPALPQDEILAQVLFGRSRAQLTPLEGVQLATGLASIAGGQAFDVVGNLRDLARLDRLVFTDSAAGITVSGGLYLGRDVFLELISVPDEGITSQVEWRPVRGTAITSRVSADGDARISIRWRRDFD